MLQMAPKGSTLTPAQARLRQQYMTWLRWWRSTVSPEDYLKFVAQKVRKVYLATWWYSSTSLATYFVDPFLCVCWTACNNCNSYTDLHLHALQIHTDIHIYIKETASFLFPCRSQTIYITSITCMTPRAVSPSQRRRRRGERDLLDCTPSYS